MGNSRIKRILGLGGVLCAGVLVIAQFVPARAPRNPAVVQERTLEATLQPPAHIRAIMSKACLNCHSHETHWPWYAKVAPFSWLVARDVERARGAVNFSEWSEKKPAVTLGILAAACSDVQTGRMPLRPYRLLHPEARLTSQEKDWFCAWTSQAMRQLPLQAKQNRNRNPGGVN